MREHIEHHLVSFTARFEKRLVFRLTHFNPQAFAAGEIGQHHIGLVGVRESRSKRQYAITVAGVL